MKLNEKVSEESSGIKTKPLHQGVSLKINIPAKKLFVSYTSGQHQKLLKTYKIAVGTRQFQTPVGTKKIRQVVWNPWWIPPKSGWAVNDRPTPPGPKNPLGPVKIKLEGSAIMIHGTNKESTVGFPRSHGCIRMYREKAKELARFLQDEMTGNGGDALYEKYEANGGKSFYVNIDQGHRIPVTFAYDLVEIRKGRLHVYQDIYNRVPNKAALIKKVLAANGYDPSRFNMKFVTDYLAKGKKTDLSFSISKLMRGKSKKSKKSKKHIAFNDYDYVVGRDFNDI